MFVLAKPVDGWRESVAGRFWPYKQAFQSSSKKLTIYGLFLE